MHQIDLIIDNNIDLTGVEFLDSSFVEFCISKTCSELLLEDSYSLCIRICDEIVSKHINSSHRNKNKSTNIISINYELDDIEKSIQKEIYGENIFLGDLLICLPVMQKEAKELNIDIKYHFSHLIVHGILHLLGYDHIQDDEAEIMEKLEKKILLVNLK